MHEPLASLFARPRRPKIKPVERKRRPGILQADLIPLLLESIPGSRTQGWLEETFKAFSGIAEVVGVEDDFKHALKTLNLIPDAFVIHKDEDALHFFEVEVTHRLKPEKLQNYAAFVTDMDFYGITFELYTVSQHGHINRVDLLPHYFDWIRSMQDRAAAGEVGRPQISRKE